MLMKESTVMPNQAYFPSNEAERVIWLTHFCNKLPIHGPNLGLSAADISSTLADVGFYVWVIGTWYPSVQQNALEATAYKTNIANGTGSDAVPLPTPAVFTQAPTACSPGVLIRLSTLVQRIKLSSTYNDSVGQDLGIIGSQDNSIHLTPDFTASNERGANMERVKITFTKYQHDGVYIESRRNNGVWEFLSIAMVKPWYDERPLLDSATPEIREYRLRWWDKGVANGELSPVQRVTVAL
jgi:hypothetical protein